MHHACASCWDPSRDDAPCPGEANENVQLDIFIKHMMEDCSLLVAAVSACMLAVRHLRIQPFLDADLDADFWMELFNSFSIQVDDIPAPLLGLETIELRNINIEIEDFEDLALRGESDSQPWEVVRDWLAERCRHELPVRYISIADCPSFVDRSCAEAFAQYVDVVVWDEEVLYDAGVVYSHTENEGGGLGGPQRVIRLHPAYLYWCYFSLSMMCFVTVGTYAQMSACKTPRVFSEHDHCFAGNHTGNRSTGSSGSGAR